MKEPDRPEIPIQHDREPPKYAGDIKRVCANCQHFEPDNRLRPSGPCHNGISGRLTTRAIDGCEFGFYPSVERFPLRAGPGGVR
jgi:hypothetical protein